MVFSSLEFIFQFLPVFLMIYYLIPGRWKNLWLLAWSLGFYFYGVRDTPFYFVLLILSILVNYRIGILIGRRRVGRLRKRWLVCGVLYNLFWLILFKYAAFFVQNLNLLLKMAGVSRNFPVCTPVLPVGISFYTFQAISYLVDVYRKSVPCERSLVGFGMYISMFPQLIAGPIVTYSSIRAQIGRRRVTFRQIEDGLREFTIGLGFKVLLANRIGGLWSQVQAIGFESISTPLAWLGLAAFSLQIYFDFCGYSLMAKGLGAMMGFKLPDNFDHPYLSRSMTEFWRRWHMTLGRWFKKYLYFPLGGSRCSFAKTIRNTFVVWAFTGLWHGASWNFVLWGLIFFALLTIERLGLGKLLAKTKVLKHIYVIFLIPLTWVVFALPNMQDIATYFSRLFPFFADNTASFVNTKDVIRALHDYWYLLIACVVFCLPFPSRWYEKHKNSKLVILGLVLIYLMSVYKMQTQTSNPFLYYQF